MSLKSILRPRTVAAVAVATILGSSAYAFAASNTVPTTNAGDGNGVVSGYTISNTAYTLNATNPDALDGVSFDIAPGGGGDQPGLVKIQLKDAGTWFTCDGTAAPEWTCDVTGSTVNEVTKLRVVARD